MNQNKIINKSAFKFGKIPISRYSDGQLGWAVAFIPHPCLSVFNAFETGKIVGKTVNKFYEC